VSRVIAPPRAKQPNTLADLEMDRASEMYPEIIHPWMNGCESERGEADSLFLIKHQAGTATRDSAHPPSARRILLP